MGKENATNPQPVERRDRINLGLLPFDNVLVSFRTVLNGGVVNPHSINVPLLYRALGVNSQTFDFTQNDAFTCAFAAILGRTLDDIRADAAMTALLQKPTWDMHDRLTWEKKIAETVDHHHAHTTGLAAYRAVTWHEGQPQARRRVDSLNELSADINANSTWLEHDCETMAAIEGMALQLVESHFLEDRATTAPGDYKYAGNYYYAPLLVNFAPGHAKFALHTAVVSSVTGNIIEATTRDRPEESTYQIGNGGFDAFLQGAMVLTQSGAIYQFDAWKMAKARFSLQEGLMNEVLAFRRAHQPQLPGGAALFAAVAAQYAEKSTAASLPPLPNPVRRALEWGSDASPEAVAALSAVLADGITYSRTFHWLEQARAADATPQASAEVQKTSPPSQTAREALAAAGLFSGLGQCGEIEEAASVVTPLIHRMIAEMNAGISDAAARAPGAGRSGR